MCGVHTVATIVCRDASCRYHHCNNLQNYITHTNTHTRLTVLFPGLPGSAGTRKVKPIWILLSQESVSGSGISSATSLQTDIQRQHPTTQFFTGRMPFLPPNQQCQSTEGTVSVVFNSWQFMTAVMRRETL